LTFPRKGKRKELGMRGFSASDLRLHSLLPGEEKKGKERKKASAPIRKKEGRRQYCYERAFELFSQRAQKKNAKSLLFEKAKGEIRTWGREQLD